MARSRPTNSRRSWRTAARDQANRAETYRAMDMDHDGKVSRQELAASMPFTPQDFLALVASSREAKLYQP
ncbi:EF-hand domain-containing protein [Cupriavidus sp. Marseille-Q8015]